MSPSSQEQKFPLSTLAYNPTFPKADPVKRPAEGNAEDHPQPHPGKSCHSGEGYLSFLCDLGITMKMGPIAQGLEMRGFERSQYQSYAQPPP